MPTAPDGLRVLAVRYAPARLAGEPFTPSFDLAGTDLVVSAGEFTAVVGPPEGDENGEPTLRLTH